MWTILRTFARELTHYMQHINGLELTHMGDLNREKHLYYKVKGFVLSPV